MTRLFVPALLTLCLLATGTLPAAGRGMLPGETGPAVGVLLEMAERGERDRLDASLSRLTGDGDRPLREREAILHGFALRARELPIEAVPLDALERLADYESRLQRPHPESRGALTVPVFDVARVAQGTLNYAAFERAVAHAGRELARDPAGFWRTRRAAKADQRTGVLAAAVGRVERATLAAGREPLVAAWEARPALAPAVAEAAIRLGDRQLAERLIREGDEASARRILAKLTAFPGDGEATALIRRAAARPELASLAIETAGRRLGESGTGRGWLYRKLDDERLGASAAAALARHGGPAAVEYASSTLDPALTRSAVAHRVLLLHLAGTRSARARLSAFVDDPAMPADLRREVGRW